MRIAGVRLAEQCVVWVDAGNYRLEPLDRVVLGGGNEETEGKVYLTPEQLRQAPEEVAGKVLRKLPTACQTPEAVKLPGSEMPPLGTCHTLRGITGTVTGIDPLEQIVTITDSSGEAVSGPAAEAFAGA